MIIFFHSSPSLQLSQLALINLTNIFYRYCQTLLKLLPVQKYFTKITDWTKYIYITIMSVQRKGRARQAQGIQFVCQRVNVFWLDHYIKLEET